MREKKKKIGALSQEAYRKESAELRPLRRKCVLDASGTSEEMHWGKEGWEIYLQSFSASAIDYSIEGSIWRNDSKQLV